MGLHDRLKTSNGSTSATAELLTGGQSHHETSSPSPAQDPYAELKTRIHHACIATLGAELFKREATGDMGERVTRAVTEQLVLDRTPLTREERRQIIREITDDILGYGPLENFLRDDSVTEVMVNAYDQIYVERLGKLERVQASFADNSHLLRIIDKIVSQIGRRVDEASPMVDARLPDGSRVNAIIPPLALKGPTLTIRKFARDPYTMNDLISFGSVSPKAAQFLAACVKGKLNVLISGGTGTGKTTLLNALAAHIPDRDRIVLIEETAEIHLNKPDVVRLEARRAQPALGQEAPLPPVTIADLLRAALRHRPDRILVGEVRGAEAFDLLQALNTGHLGSLSTIHANSAEQALTRLAHCVLTANVGLPHRSIREAIGLAIHLVVHIGRIGGHRRVTQVAAVRGYDVQSDRFLLESRLLDQPAPQGALS